MGKAGKSLHSNRQRLTGFHIGIKACKDMPIQALQHIDNPHAARQYTLTNTQTSKKSANRKVIPTF